MDDGADFGERFRDELRVHCYRMTGSLDEAEDLVQETLLKAWKARAGLQDPRALRAWLYRIATNTCLDALTGRARRALPYDAGPAAEVLWLQPYPDHLWQPEAAAEARETLELAFLAAIQHLPPRQRAVVILHDVLGWPARQAAEALDGSLASVNSALQRARATLREHLPPGRSDWAPAAPPTAEERQVLRRYMAAVERGDLTAIAGLLAEDVRTGMPPYREWYAGREAVLAAFAASWDPAAAGYVGEFRMLPMTANGALGSAIYLRAPGTAEFLPTAIGLLRTVRGRIVEITAFHDPSLFPAFRLPARPGR